jgi:division protein CdvB (Snf7/Vps24/ESCRT-III family)
MIEAGEALTMREGAALEKIPVLLERVALALEALVVTLGSGSGR